MHDHSRMPSYCDRIIYRKTPTEGPAIILHEYYNSYANNTIMQSDHDLVYGIFSVGIGDKIIKILILTWNQSNQNPLIDDVISPDFFDKLNDPIYTGFESFDIICMSQQESSMYDTFSNIFERMDSLQKSIIHKQKTDLFDYEIFHGKTGVPRFYVRLSVLVKKELLGSNYNIINNSQCLQLPICSKSVVGIGLTLGDIPITLNFFAAHLPINTTARDMGLVLRTKALNEITDFIFDKFTSKDINQINQIDFIAGDLNFRYNTGNISGDQLVDQMTKTDSPLKGFAEGELNFGPTCKMNTCLNHKKNEK